MSQKRKRGLQDSLSNIIKRQTAPIVVPEPSEPEESHQQVSLEEKKKRTSEILGLFKEADKAPASKFEKPKLVARQADHDTPVKMADAAKMTTAAILDEPPTPMADAAKMTTAAKMADVVIIPSKEGYTNYPNFILDGLLPLLDPSASLVYLRLYRLSHGFGSETCTVGTGKLASSLNMGERTVERAIQKLKTTKLVEQLGSNFGKGIKGNIYKVYLPETYAKMATVAKTAEVVTMTTVAKTTTNKDHDHDHDLKKNHHQSAAPNYEVTEHEKETMMIYKELTGKDWTKGDHAAYESGQIAELHIEQLRDLMAVIHSRAEQPIGSFKFFATSIAKELSEAGQQSRAMLKKKYERFVAEIAAINTGRNDYSISDRIYDLKNRCIRDGVQWNDDIANEVFNI